MSYPLDELSPLWVIPFMSYPLYELSSRWVIPSMSYPLYDLSFLWVILCMSNPRYELSSLWVILSMGHAEIDGCFSSYWHHWIAHRIQKIRLWRQLPVYAWLVIVRSPSNDIQLIASVSLHLNWFIVETDLIFSPSFWFYWFNHSESLQRVC